jgi:hypothetical protein
MANRKPRKTERPALRWVKQPSLYGGRRYRAEHGGRIYLLALSGAKPGNLQDPFAHLLDVTMSEQLRSFGVFRSIRGALDAQLEAEQVIFTDLEKIVYASHPKATRNPAPEPVDPRNPLLRLRMHLARLYRLADNGAQFLSVAEDRQEQGRLAELLRQADLYLTGKAESRAYLQVTVDVLTAGTPTLQLSDGGYSRLTVTLLEAELMGLDRRLSTPRVVERWDAVFNRGV